MFQASPAGGRSDVLAADGCAPCVSEHAGYLADTTVFNFIRAGVSGIVDRCGIAAPVHLCHSLGCFVGLDAASREPGAVVIAINMPASPWYGFRRAAMTAARMTQIARRDGVAEANRFRNSWVYFGRPNIDDVSRQRLKRIHQQTNCYAAPRRQDTALFLRAAMLEHRRRGPHSPRVLVVQGELDPIAPAHHEALLRKRLPDCTVTTINGAHVLPVTHPREVVRAIGGFLSAM